MKPEKFSWKSRLRSFRYAFEGLYQAFRFDHNLIIHLLATLAVAALCFIFPVNKMELISLVVVIAMVWIAELFNTAIEKLADHVSEELHPRIKFIKDISAAAVLIAAIAAVVVGAIVFVL